MMHRGLAGLLCLCLLGCLLGCDSETLAPTPTTALALGDGTALYLGSVSHFGAADAGVGGDAWLAHVDQTGRFLWRTVLGTDKHEELLEVVRVESERFFAVGSIEREDRDGWMILLEPNGHVAWQQALGAPGDQSISQTSEGPSHQRTVLGRATVADWTGFFLARLSVDGELLWQRRLLGEGGFDVAELISRPDSGLFIVGTLAASMETPDGEVTVLSVSADGRLEWQRAYAMERPSHAHDAELTGDGGLLIAATTGTEEDPALSIHRLRSDGVDLWHTLVRRNALTLPRRIVELADGGALVLASTVEVVGKDPHDEDIWLIGLGADGTLKNQLAFGSRDSERALDMVPLGGALQILAATVNDEGPLDFVQWRLGDRMEVVEGCGSATPTTDTVRSLAATPREPAFSIDSEIELTLTPTDVQTDQPSLTSTPICRP